RASRRTVRPSHVAPVSGRPLAGPRHELCCSPGPFQFTDAQPPGVSVYCRPVHGRLCVLTDSPRASPCTDGQATGRVCVLTDSPRAALCTDGQPTWAKITRGQSKSPEEPKIQKLIFLRKIF